MPTPRPFTLAQARPIIAKLVHPNRFQLWERNGICAAYLNDDPQPHTFAQDWETVMANLYDKKMEEKA